MIYMSSMMGLERGGRDEAIGARLFTNEPSYTMIFSNTSSASKMNRLNRRNRTFSDVRHPIYQCPVAPYRHSPREHHPEPRYISSLEPNIWNTSFPKMQRSPTDKEHSIQSAKPTSARNSNQVVNAFSNQSRWTLCSFDNEKHFLPPLGNSQFKSCPSLSSNLEHKRPTYSRSFAAFDSVHNDKLLASRDNFTCHSSTRLIQDNENEDHLLASKLLYFPRMRTKFRVQFKPESHSMTRLDHMATGSYHVPSMGPVLPLLFGHTTNRLAEPTAVVVESKNERQPSTALLISRKVSDTYDRMMSAHTTRKRLSSLFPTAKKIRHRSGTDSNLFHSSTVPIHPKVVISGQSESAPHSGTSSPGYDRVVLNVSGLRFETWLAVLKNHPTTLLGNAAKRAPYYDSRRKEYFFDRHRPSFEAIFNYYQYGGRLKRPAVVCDDIFLKELEFFELEKEAVESYKKNEGYVPELIILPENPRKRKLWLLFEYPETSLLAFCFSATSVVFTIISIILFCVETLPMYSHSHCKPGDKPNFGDAFFIIETVCTLWFTFEIFIRFFSCPSRWAFVKDLKNLIDLAAIVPYYITLINVLTTFSCEGAKNSASLAFLRVIRLIRVFKLTKHSSGLQVLVLTFKESIEGLGLFLVAFIVCILVFSSTIYYVEIDRKGSQIESIPDAFWWAVITMCTVGYGDKVPKGPLGKVVGGVCAVAGVLTLAIPVPIITENFNKFYSHKTGRSRR